MDLRREILGAPRSVRSVTRRGLEANNERRRTGFDAWGTITDCSGVDAVEDGREGVPRNEDAVDDVADTSACVVSSPGVSGALRTMRRRDPLAHHLGRACAAAALGGSVLGAVDTDAGEGGKNRSEVRSAKRSLTPSIMLRVRGGRYRAPSDADGGSKFPLGSVLSTMTRMLPTEEEGTGPPDRPSSIATGS
jgi:hypothetical protein